MGTVYTNNETETKALASRIAKWISPGMTILLEGELGAGKTTFAKGIAEGLGISRIIKSPTYTLIREYTDGRLPLYHMDLYRLEDTGAEELGLDEYFEGKGVCVVEWASFASEELPKEYLKIELNTVLDNLEKREISFLAVGEPYENILEKLVDE